MPLPLPRCWRYFKDTNKVPVSGTLGDRILSADESKNWRNSRTRKLGAQLLSLFSTSATQLVGVLSAPSMLGNRTQGKADNN